ncbi:hypothetical protein [Novosphingobium sp. ST904]|uniref:hypothetical protein n=1 Tax=Novosphingobium sp. ST904 TaxID=1684385 RepID=UPI0006C886C8|nr:hypothetical protein [Novosphingobium sp. ST904]KPH66330.1 hypothetical protein ADT71_06585 [Novosphingobium sp. ST904]TCM42091.1 hypothetical protein EDF59_10252 [Novosphingobium sp. ST904]
MAFTAKFTFTRGKPRSGDIAITAGAAEAARDVISLNIDADKITKGEALIAIDNIKAAVFAARWPVN